MSNSFATPWTVARQAPLSMGFPRQEYWSVLPFPSPGDFPDQGIKLAFPTLAGEFFTTEPASELFKRSVADPTFSLTPTSQWGQECQAHSRALSSHPGLSTSSVQGFQEKCLLKVDLFRTCNTKLFLSLLEHNEALVLGLAVTLMPTVHTDVNMNTN